MKKLFKQLAILVIAIELFQPLLVFAEPRATDDGYVPETIEESSENDDEVEPVTEEEIEPSVEGEFEDLEGESEDFSSDSAGDIEKLPITAVPNESPSKYLNDENKRIIMDGTDERKLAQLQVAHSALPDLENDLEELASATGSQVEELYQTREQDPKAFYKLVTDAKKKISNNDYLASRLMNNPTKLAEFFEIDEGEAIDKINSDKDFLKAEILNELNHSIDRRVIKTLAYLIKPKNLGGAGHYRIKVERITKNYNTENKKEEREDIAIREEEKTESSSNTEAANKTIEGVRSDDTSIDKLYDPTDSVAVAIVNHSKAIVDVINAEGESTASILIGDNELEPETVSAHFTGQAVDISEIDDIKCTLIEKKRIGGDKKTPKSPQPIKLLYQTEAGYNSEKDQIDASYNEMFLSASTSALENMFASLNLDATDIGNQEFNNFSDIAEAVGKSIFGSSIDTPLKNIWNNNLDDMLRVTGGALLADNLGLPREAFIDGNIESVEALSEAIGRSYIEKELNLPSGSLKGESQEEILENIGLARIAKELRLPTDTFSTSIDSSEMMNKRIGSRIVEWEFGFPAGSFSNKDNMNALISAAGKSRIDSFFQNPSYIDGKLGLPEGTTLSLRNGGVSINDYVSKVAAGRLMRSAYAYPNYSGGSGCRTTTSGWGRFETICSDNQATVDGNKSNWRDEMMNLPEGTIDSFLSSGNINSVKSQLKEAGIYSLVKTLEKNNSGMDRLTSWLKNPSSDFSVQVTKDATTGDTEKVCLPISNYASKLKLKSSDFYQLLGDGSNARGIFKRLGKSLLSYALKPDGSELKMEKETLNTLPNFNVPTESEDFYTSRATSLLSSISGLNQVIASLKDNLNKVSDEASKEAANTLRDKGEEISKNLENSVKLLDSKTGSTEIMDLNKDVLKNYYALSAKLTDAASLATKESNELQRAVSAAIYQIEKMGKLSYEISVSSDESDFRFEDININNININVANSSSETYVSTKNIALLLSGRVDFKTFLKGLGSSKIGGSIDLPGNALMTVSKFMGSGETENTEVASTLIRSVAWSIFESNSGYDLSKITADDLKEKVSIDRLISLFVNKLGVSNSKAETLVAKFLNLEGSNLDKLRSGDFSAWAKARAKAEMNDINNGLPQGTTENFILNKPLGKYDQSLVSNKEISSISNSLEVSEASLKNFIAKKEGAENPGYNKIYYKSYIASTGSSDSLTSGYVYNDSDGAHTFKTYEEAEKYRLANSSKEIDFLEDIANGLSKSAGSALGSVSDVKNKLGTFLNSKDKNAFGDQFKDLEKALYNQLGISRDVISRLFARNGSDNDLGAVDYFRILGDKHLAKNVLPQINSDLNTGLGFAKLDSNDLVKIINGEGREVLSKVGAYLVDNEMGTTPGTILKLMSTKDDSEKSSLSKKNAFELIGNALGIKGLSFKNTSDLAEQFGLGKIENVLNLAKGSFKGKNLDEMLENVSLFDLASSLSLPASDDLKSKIKDTLKSISKGENIPLSFKEQLGMLKAYQQGAGLDGLSEENKAKVKDIEKSLKETSKKLLSNTEALGADTNAAKDAFKSQLDSIGSSISSSVLLDQAFANFRSTVEEVSSGLNLTGSTLLNAFAGKSGLSIEGIVKQTSLEILKNDATNTLGKMVADVLNVGNKTVNDTSLRSLLGQLRNSLLSSVDGGSGLDLGDVGRQLKELFTANFDDKAGFTFKTFESIFENAGKTLPILLEQGLSRLDAQLGTASDELMKKFANVSINSLGKDWSSLISAGANIASALNSSIVPVAGSVINAVSTAENIADKAVTALNNETKVLQKVVEFTISGQAFEKLVPTPSISDLSSYTGQLKDTMGDIFKGDFRPLEVIGIINSIPNIVGKECTKPDGSIGTCLSVPTDFKFDLGSIFGSVFGEVLGNTSAEDSLAAQAVQWVVESTGTGSMTADLANQIATGQTSLSTLFSSLSQSALATPGSDGYANLRFPIASVLSGNPLESLGGELLSKALSIESIVRSTFQEDIGKIFQFKSIDCSLFKDNPLIPKNFAAAMFAGSPFDKANILKTFMGGWMGGDGLSALSAVFGDKAAAIADIFKSDGPINLESVAAVAGIDLTSLASQLDSVILSNAPTIMGVNLGGGIAESLLSFAQTGSLDLGATAAGQMFKSFKENFSIDGAVGMIGGWADEKLGLPAGTTMAIYNTLVGNATATFMMAGVALTGPLAIVAQIVVAKLQEVIMGVVMKFVGQIMSSIEGALGLVPGSLMTLLMTGLSPIGFAMFVVTNLTGVYKVLLVCTADGYYPSLESPPDPKVWDNGNLGTFDGLKSEVRKANYIKAAQYKADRLIKDVLEMAEATNDEELVPAQIMTGRQEDIGPNIAGVDYAICPKVKSSGVYKGTALCEGWNSRSGLFFNPQTTAWTHIGF